jgi:hypothetical protein
MLDNNLASLPTLSNNTTSRKRKVLEDLSQNPNTIKAYKHSYKLSQDPIRSKVKKAKAVD